MRRLFIAISLLAVLPAALVRAAPIRYRMSVSVPALESHPLSAARIEVDVAWDAAQLSPMWSQAIPSRGVPTETSSGWPPTNTEGIVTITGGTPFDGEFPISLRGVWEVRRINNSTHLIYFPALLVEVGGEGLEISRMSVRYASSSLTNSLPAYPDPFPSANVIRAQAAILSSSRAFESLGITTVSGYAVAVPEPSTLALGSFALLSLVALRRRK